MRKLLFTLQSPVQMSPLGESQTPSGNVLPLLQDPQPRDLSLHHSPDNKGLQVSGSVSPRIGAP